MNHSSGPSSHKTNAPLRFHFNNQPGLERNMFHLNDAYEELEFRSFLPMRYNMSPRTIGPCLAMANLVLCPATTVVGKTNCSPLLARCVCSQQTISSNCITPFCMISGLQPGRDTRYATKGYSLNEEYEFAHARVVQAHSCICLDVCKRRL